MRADTKVEATVAVDDLQIQEVQQSVITHLAVLTSGVNEVKGQYLYSMLKYCFGWGVVDTPPDEHELYDLFGAVSERDKRAVWVQHVVCADILEARELMTKIMNYEEPEESEEPEELEETRPARKAKPRK